MIYDQLFLTLGSTIQNGGQKKTSDISPARLLPTATVVIIMAAVF